MSSEHQQTQQNAVQDMVQWQQNALRQGQRAFEQTIDMQQNMAESMWRNNLETSRNVQRQGTDLARNWMDAFFGAMGTPMMPQFRMGTMMPQEETDRMRKNLQEQFEELDEAQDEAWEAFGESLDESIQAYEDLTESQKELVNRSVDSVMEVEASMGEEVARVTEQMGEQVREGSRQVEEASRQAEQGSQDSE